VVKHRKPEAARVRRKKMVASSKTAKSLRRVPSGGRLRTFVYLSLFFLRGADAQVITTEARSGPNVVAIYDV
jgi:hypothetical protein